MILKCQANTRLKAVRANATPVMLNEEQTMQRLLENESEITTTRRNRQRHKFLDTINVTGGVGSPRHYGGVSKDQPLLSPSHPLTGCTATPTHNQHNANNTQHFSNHQHSSMLYHNAAGVQSSQYCYDRTSVNMYQSGPGDAQDCRPPPPSNPASHQMGGKSYDLFMSCDHHCAIYNTHHPLIRSILFLSPYIIVTSRPVLLVNNYTTDNDRSLLSISLICLYNLCLEPMLYANFTKEDTFSMKTGITVYRALTLPNLLCCWSNKLPSVLRIKLNFNRFFSPSNSTKKVLGCLHCVK